MIDVIVNGMHVVSQRDRMTGMLLVRRRERHVRTTYAGPIRLNGVFARRGKNRPVVSLRPQTVLAARRRKERLMRSG